MKFSSAITLTIASLPSALAWGSLGHIATAYLASHLVSNTTEAHLKDLLRNQNDDYLASVASWADSVRYTKWGRFTKNFHFIDSHDNPPDDCSVDFKRDCKAGECILTSMANYTRQMLDADLSPWRRAQAAKFVIHFVGDLHQPLHNEDVAHGGNSIHVLWQGKEYNLHHVWDTRIAEKWIGAHGKPTRHARKWAVQLADEIKTGKYAAHRDAWLKDLDMDNAVDTALAWARECNAVVCTHVFPEGPEAIRGQELSGEYFEKAGPVIERLVAQAGVRMAVWLDTAVDRYLAAVKQREEAGFLSEDL
ncbi:Nuclease S1 [Escovopsis weberi]|uniref:Nuclease S1 n=1 Tax=Escovopsis weberi TaxID=150374 RepID=A0A0M8N4S1_ESCWE|nr:Nuclease S1 [Escovopsis weberi]